MSKWDYFIVGQGLAGSLLHSELEKYQARCLVIDQGLKGTASSTAAGIINPVTGRRYVKSWKVDELIPLARTTYEALGNRFNQQFYFPHPIIRTLFNRREQQDWLVRTGDPEYQPYLLETANLGAYEHHTVPAFAYGETRESGRVDLGALVQCYREYLVSQNQLLEASFDPATLTIGPEGLTYQDHQAPQIIFCEGHLAQRNPWFGYLPYNGTKGEVLIIRVPGLEAQKLLKHRLFLVPLGNEIFWVGSTYQWDYEDDSPTDKERTFLMERLDDLLKLPYEVFEHRAAIRPTVKDRRPFLGRHPEEERLAIFNGLGAKGASLGPYFAREMAAYLEKGNPLTPEVDIRRFDK